MKTWVMAAALLPFAGAAHSAAMDCQAAQDYLSAAQQKVSVSEFDGASNLAQQAVDACPSYLSYESLGEARAQSLNRPDRARAVDAFVAAHELAANDHDRAHTLYEYALLLNADGDPQNAYPLIKDAKTIDPADTEIVALAQKIKQRIDNPTKEQIVRGLWNSMYKPLRVASITTPQHGGSAAKQQPDKAAAPSVNILINFELGTTVVDERTHANIAVLADALADPTYAQQHFTFVGHADERGVEPNNVVLSKRRAEAICQAVIVLQPTLRGRIEVVGRGSAEPLDPGHDEEAWHANRRLQVLLR